MFMMRLFANITDISKNRLPTNTQLVFHVKTTWKRLFPLCVNVEYTWCVCRDIGFSGCFCRAP